MYTPTTLCTARVRSYMFTNTPQTCIKGCIEVNVSAINVYIIVAGIYPHAETYEAGVRFEVCGVRMCEWVVGVGRYGQLNV